MDKHTDLLQSADWKLFFEKIISVFKHYSGERKHCWIPEKCVNTNLSKFKSPFAVSYLSKLDKLRKTQTQTLCVMS